jgi:hypothetical protein
MVIDDQRAAHLTHLLEPRLHDAAHQPHQFCLGERRPRGSGRPPRKLSMRASIRIFVSWVSDILMSLLPWANLSLPHIDQTACGVWSSQEGEPTFEGAAFRTSHRSEQAVHRQPSSIHHDAGIGIV